MRRLVLLLIALFAACNPPTNGSKAVATADPVDVETLLFGDEGFQQKLRAAIVAKGAEYQPRTKHKRADGSPRYVNRLILEASPYLVQHAHNPVNWFPWGDEAFALAKQLNRPVFLSVGYATCHWCHVMEEESFEDEEVAKLINAQYIPVKVDREERPDVDAIYMRAVMLLTSRGGWPMSVWLTPERKPFYAGTYFPARDGDRGVRKGFSTLLREQASAYARDPSGVSNDAEQLAAQVQRDLAPPKSTELPTGKTIAGARETAERRYDPVHGGPKGRPKFPASFPIRFLLRHGLRAGDARSTAMALDSLRKMQAGGIYDHVGGGFHRYTVDEVWLVPHFEKMLYDNARLSIAYLEALQISRAGGSTGDADFERVARETLDYIEREMTAPAGGYYSATDADSLGPGGERQEGYYFTWTPSEIDTALGEANGKLVRAYYGVTAAGNFERGRSILHTPKSRAEVAVELGISVEALTRAIAESIHKLRAARNERARPILDDKILVGHNGLMIAAMARGARVLGEQRYLESAQKAAGFVLEKLMVDGRLMHSFHAHGDRNTVSAFAEDYAFLAGGLIDLFEASHDPRWLAAAVAMMDQLQAHHGHTAGGYFRTADDAERLLAREIEQRDGAIPSASAWALMNQLRLWTLTTDDRWRQRAEITLRAFAALLADQPWTLDEMMLAVDYYTDSPKEVVLVLPEGTAREAPEAQAMLDVMRDHYVPNHVFVLASRPPSEALAKLVPWASDKPAKNGKPTAYVCERGACDLPTTEPLVFAKQVTKVVPYPAPAGEEE